jgi:hypothetical protein
MQHSLVNQEIGQYTYDQDLYYAVALVHFAPERVSSAI